MEILRSQMINFLELRQVGKYNMLDSKVRKEIGLSTDEHRYLIENFSQLLKSFGLELESNWYETEPTDDMFRIKINGKIYFRREGYELGIAFADDCLVSEDESVVYQILDTSSKYDWNIDKLKLRRVR